MRSLIIICCACLVVFILYVVIETGGTSTTGYRRIRQHSAFGRSYTETDEERVDLQIGLHNTSIAFSDITVTVGDSEISVWYIVIDTGSSQTSIPRKVGGPFEEELLNPLAVPMSVSSIVCMQSYRWNSQPPIMNVLQNPLYGPVRINGVAVASSEREQVAPDQYVDDALNGLDEQDVLQLPYKAVPVSAVL